MAFPGFRLFFIGFPIHNKVGCHFIAHTYVTSCGQCDFIDQPNIRVAGMVDVIIHTVSLLTGMSQVNPFANSGVTMLKGFPCPDVFQGKQYTAPNDNDLSLLNGCVGEYAFTMNGRGSHFKTRIQDRGEIFCTVRTQLVSIYTPETQNYQAVQFYERYAQISPQV